MKPTTHSFNLELELSNTVIPLAQSVLALYQQFGDLYRSEESSYRRMNAEFKTRRDALAPHMEKRVYGVTIAADHRASSEIDGRIRGLDFQYRKVQSEFKALEERIKSGLGTTEGAPLALALRLGSDAPYAIFSVQGADRAYQINLENPEGFELTETVPLLKLGKIQLGSRTKQSTVNAPSLKTAQQYS